MHGARGSSRRHSLQAVLLWMEGRESTEAFDFAFGPVEEYLDDLRTLALKGKPFGMFSFRLLQRADRRGIGTFDGRCSR